MLRAARTELRSRSSERFLDQVPRICPHARTVPVGRVPCFPDFLMDTQVENNQGQIRNRGTEPREIATQHRTRRSVIQLPFPRVQECFTGSSAASS